RPLTAHGFKDATTHATQIKKWWQDHPNALIGMPTGERAGIDVLDIDDPHTFEAEYNLGFSGHTVVKTRKGFHVWFERDPSQPLKSRVRPMPGADTRGDGGYVIVPPSRHDGGAYYFEHSGPLKPMPQELLTRLVKRPKKVKEPQGNRHAPLFCSMYGAKALRSECDAIRNANDGEQEFTLNAAALKIGSLVAGDELDRRTAHDELLCAAMQMKDFDPGKPWTKDQLKTKIERGLDHGARNPRTAPSVGTSDGITAAELAQKHFAPLKWVIPNILPEGCYLLTARPKVGKSWLGLQISLAVALGLVTLGQQASKGKAVYLALEDNQRRLQDRLKQLRPQGYATSDLLLFTEWPRFDAGGLDRLKELIERERPKLVVIDTLAKVRPATTNSNVYEQDYKALAPLTEMANRNRCCIVVVHHNRKGKSDADALEQISGSLGLAGAVDGALVIDGVRSEKQYKLSLIGRDIPNDDELAISRKANGEWEVLGVAQQVFISAERKQITDLLAFHPDGLKPREIADHLGKRQNATRKLLMSMVNDQQLKVTHGLYSTPTHFGNGSSSGVSGNPGNGGNA
ncbi:MAG: hypothetical protein RLZZ84_183, partial [Pseudomonadota bacterium]